jgi:hypothetical protein
MSSEDPSVCIYCDNTKTFPECPCCCHTHEADQYVEGSHYNEDHRCCVVE